MDAKQAEQEIISDIFEEGKLEDETGRMDVSIKPNEDIEGKYPEQEVAEAIEDAKDERIVETVTAGTDEDGNAYGEVEETVTGE